MHKCKSANDIKKSNNMKQKVFIEIEYLDIPNVDRSQRFSVHFYAKRYGSGSPCNNEQEVKKAIQSCIEWIKKEGDIPIVRDLRQQVNLFNF